VTQAAGAAINSRLATTAWTSVAASTGYPHSSSGKPPCSFSDNSSGSDRHLKKWKKCGLSSVAGAMWNL
jgi:hypothetical protein